VSLRAAGEEALDEIERLESQLSLYQPTSELSYINARAAQEAVRVEPGLFRLLIRARELTRKTDGAFDVTIAPLMRCWGFINASGRLPDAAEIAEARARVGMHLVELDEATSTIRFERPGVMLDLGSIGKGYALENAAQLLVDAGVTSALLHGGTSTVCALGNPPGANSWKVAIPDPASLNATAAPRPGIVTVDSISGLLAVVPLRNESLSVSAVWGKSFQAGGKVYGHVMDPRIGAPVQGAVMAAVMAPRATDTDALSTALLTLGSSGLDAITAASREVHALVSYAGDAAGDYRVASRGVELLKRSTRGG
jgi:thiamine biosynthesis lipoprotein